MSEIEKMYENAGIEKQYCGWLQVGDLDTNVQYVRCKTKEKYDNYAALDSSDLIQIIPDEVYPPFTAEKQLWLIKWLAIKGDFDSSIDIAKNTYDYWTIYFQGAKWTDEGFEESLAGLINTIWQDLTEEEKQEIKEILE